MTLSFALDLLEGWHSLVSPRGIEFKLRINLIPSHYNDIFIFANLFSLSFSQREYKWNLLFRYIEKRYFLLQYICFLGERVEDNL